MHHSYRSLAQPQSAIRVRVRARYGGETKPEQPVGVQGQRQKQRKGGLQEDVFLDYVVVWATSAGPWQRLNQNIG